ncbi:MAG: type II secretion system protein GspC [Polyangiales bacterium]
MATPRESRFSAAILFGTLGLCAFFLAQGATRVLASALLAPKPVEESAPSKPLPNVASTFLRKRDPTPMLRRNIFDSARGDLTAEPLPDAGEGSEGQPIADWDPSKPAPTCTGKLRLVGSVMSPGYPEWSFAAIAGTSDGKTMLYREGSSVDGSRVMAVYASSVVVSASSGACQLLMFGEEEAGMGRSTTPSNPTPPAAATRMDPRSAGLNDAELEEGIERISDTRFKIQRSLVDKALANQGSLMKAARVIPHEENGRVVGVKLYGIRRNSLLGRLGVRNGDMLRTINGFDMTSPDTALEAYSRLRTADKLTLAVKRQNNEMTIEYDIE